MRQIWHNLSGMERVLVRFSILLLTLPTLVFFQVVYPRTLSHKTAHGRANWK
jgi:hypothetical protein